MHNQFFPPTEEELDQMIKQLEKDMEEAESQLEFNDLKAQLEQLLQQKQSLNPEI